LVPQASTLPTQSLVLFIHIFFLGILRSFMLHLTCCMTNLACHITIFASLLVHSFIYGHYHINLLQLQMVITEGVTQLWTCHYTQINICYGKSNLECRLCSQIIFCFLSIVMKQSSSKGWHIVVGSWSIKDGCCVMYPLLWVLVATCGISTNWSSSKTYLQTFRPTNLQALRPYIC
jgi:hypothetical protein